MVKGGAAMREEQKLSKILKENSHTISADTFRRICLLNIVDAFRLGSYGSKRLHKIAYVAERDPKQIRPFEFKRHLFGQYSETLDVIKDQLISMGYIAALPLDTAKTMYLKLPDGKSIDLTIGGNKYVITNRARMDFYRDALAQIYPDLQSAIRQAVHDYGYLQEDELITRCYEFPEFVRTEPDQIIFDSNLPEQIDVPNLSIDDCDELELSLNPKFIPAMTKIIEGLEQSKFDFDRIEVIDKSL
jgi:hypothetical protein